MYPSGQIVGTNVVVSSPFQEQSKMEQSKMEQSGVSRCPPPTPRIVPQPEVDIQMPDIHFHCQAHSKNVLPAVQMIVVC